MLLRASAKRLFESLMEQTADRIYIKDKQSRFIAASQALADMHGFKNRHELEGLTDFDLFSEEHAQQAFDDEQRIIETGKCWGHCCGVLGGLLDKHGGETEEKKNR